MSDPGSTAATCGCGLGVYGLGLGFGDRGLGRGLGLEDRGLGLGLKTCNLINITVMRPDRMHRMDAAYCCTCRAFRGLCLCWAHAWTVQTRINRS